MAKIHINKIIGISFLIAISVSLNGCGEKNNTIKSISPTPIPTETALNAFVGKVKPQYDVDIVSKVSGRVASVNFKEGQQVNVGDVLFALEDKDIKLQVNQAEAAVNAARANYAKVTGSEVDKQANQNKNTFEIAQTEYNNALDSLEDERKKEPSSVLLKSAEVKLQDAKSKLEKKQQLFNSGGISQQDLDNALNDYKYAQDQFDSANTSYNNFKISQQQTIENAEARLKKAEEGLRSSRTQQNIQPKVNQDNANIALAQLKQAESAYQTAKSQLDNTVCKSPVSGIIALKNIEAGEMVNTTNVVAKLVDISVVTIEVNINENMVNKVKTGDKVMVSIKSADASPFEGEIISINPIADTKSQRYPVKIKINNSNGLLKGDMLAEVLF